MSSMDARLRLKVGTKPYSENGRDIFGPRKWKVIDETKF